MKASNKNLYLILIVFLSSGCVSSSRYVSFINQKLSEEKSSIKENEFITIKNKDELVKCNTCESIKNYFVPALFYWESNSTILCDLNTEYSFYYLTKGILSAADSMKINETLNNKKIIITIENIPNSFLFERKSTSIFFVFGYASSGIEQITPKPIKLAIEYKLMENGKVIAIYEDDINCYFDQYVNSWKSSKKFTWMFIEDYKFHLESLGKNVMGNLSKNLDRLKK